MEPFNETVNRIQAEVKRGQVEQARQLAAQLSLDYPQKTEGWLWLSWLSEEPAEALHYAQYAANLEDNFSTQQAIQWAEGRLKGNHSTKKRLPPFIRKKKRPKATKLAAPEPPTASSQWQPFIVGMVICMLLLLIIWQMPRIGRLSLIAATPEIAQASQEESPIAAAAQESEEIISQSDILDLPITQSDESMAVSLMPALSPLASAANNTATATQSPSPTPTPTASKTPLPSSTPNTAILLENELLLEGAGQPVTPNPSLQTATPLSQEELAELANQPTLVPQDDLYFEDYTSNPLPTPLPVMSPGAVDSAYALWPTRDYPVIYVVQADDNITSIAERVGLQPDTLIWANDNSTINPELLTVGQELLIPAMDGVLHFVEEGDTLNKLAEIYSVDAALIAWFPGNKLKESALAAQLDSGERIMVPGGVKPATPTPPPPRVAAAPAQVAVPPQATAQAAAPPQQRYSSYFGWPTGGQITQVYSRYHGGIDIAAPMYTPILAAQSGQVSFRGWDNTGYGYSIVIDHRNGWYTRYAHLSGMYVERGDWVERGEVIALMGSTGRSTGPHLHFEILSNGYRYNPYNYLP